MNKAMWTLLVAAPFTMLYEAWVLNTLWGWFITSGFHVSQPGIAVCVGITLIASLFLHRKLDLKNTTVEEAIEMIFDSLISRTTVLIMGLITSFFV